MADAPEIKVKLTAEDTGVSAAIKELTSQLKTLKKQQDETAGSGLSLANAFRGIAAAGALLGIAKIGKDAFDSAINIGKMADKTGLTTQTLSVFHHVAEEVGVSTEVVDKALTRAAKSITEFQQGSAKAALGFKILGITQKDFIGLKSDEKIALVTTRLGAMSAGFQKATATQLIFSRGGSEFIPVANAIAGEGFDKVTASVSKLGLLLDQDSTDSFRAAKASMQELEDVGKGMATQFEAGLLPAISDVGEALVDSLTQGGVGFEQLGKYAGDAVKGIALIFLGLGQTLGTVAESIYDVFSAAWKEIKTEAETDFTALGQAAHGHLSQALDTLAAGGKKSNAIISDEVDRQKAIYKSLIDSFKADYANLFPSDAEEARRKKERIARLRPEKQTEASEVTATAGPTDAAAKAALALLEKQLQDELAIHRAYAKQTEQVDKEMFEAGEISLAEYYDRRRTAVKAETGEEVSILEQGLAAAKGAVDKAAAAKAKAETPKDVDKQEAARLQALAKVDELQTKITELQISSSTKIHALDTEEFKKREENQQKILEFHKLIDTTQGKTLDAAKQEIQIESAKMAIILRQAGESEKQVQAELARYALLKTAQATFEEDQKAGASALKDIADQKAAIEDRVANGQLFQVQADQQIRDLERSRLPQLQAIADQLVEQAKLTGDIQKIQSAEDFQKQVNQMATASNQVGQQVAQLKQNIQGSLTSGFANLFTSLVGGTMSVANAFKSLASSVLNSLSQMAAQMLAQLILTKLLKSALGGFSGGGLVPSVGGSGAFAEGGLIRGPGGPKSDSIPARVSPGEYIVKADAVSAFGVSNLEAINRGLKIPSLERLALPKFADGGLVGNMGGGGGESNINLGIGLDEGLILKHLSSKAAGNIILQHLTNNPKAAGKALSRSD
jgi:hypothetical protein